MPVSELESAEAQAAAAGGDAKRAYVQRIFSQIAPRYDLLNHLLSFNIDKAWRRKAIAALELGARATRHVRRSVRGNARRRGRAVRATGVSRAGSSAPTSPSRCCAPVAGKAPAAVVCAGRRRRARPAAARRQRLGRDRRVRHSQRRRSRRGAARSPSRARAGRALRHSRIHDAALADRSRALSSATSTTSCRSIGALVSGHRTAYAYLPRSVANFPIEEDLAARMRARRLRRRPVANADASASPRFTAAPSAEHVPLRIS